MSWTRNLLTGIGELLADTAGATWRPDGAYSAGDPWPIVLTVVPPDPDQVITLTAYPVSGDPGLADVVQGVQIRTRGTRDPWPVMDVNDAIFDALHGAEGLVLGGVPVTLAWLPSGGAIYLGPDSNGRHEHTQNVYLHAARPTQHRPD